MAMLGMREVLGKFKDIEFGMRIYPWLIHPNREVINRDMNINGGFPLEIFLMEDSQTIEENSS